MGEDQDAASLPVNGPEVRRLRHGNLPATELYQETSVHDQALASFRRSMMNMLS